MAIVPENVIDEDSRTATFERKRPHDVASDGKFSDPESQSATLRKRTKYAGKPGYQDVRDFVPSGASFTTNTAYIQDGQGSGEEEGNGKEYLEEADGQFCGSPPPAGATNEQDIDLPVDERNYVRVESPAKLATEVATWQTPNRYYESVSGLLLNHLLNLKD